MVVDGTSITYTETLWETCIGGNCTTVSNPFNGGIKNEEIGEQEGTIVCASRKRDLQDLIFTQAAVFLCAIFSVIAILTQCFRKKAATVTLAIIARELDCFCYVACS